MKKYFIIVLILLFSIPFFQFVGTLDISYATSDIYAKVDTSGVFIYSAPREGEENKLFELPKSYFVRLIEKANNDFYYCAYKDVYGYTKISDVIAMDGKPVNPFVEANFRVFSLEGQGLYSLPQLLDEYKLASIPYLTDTLVYYGRRIGQEAVPDKSSEWIYCKYSDSSNHYGYTYSVFCDKLPTISENTERFEVITTPFASTAKAGELSTVAMSFIIIGVSLPCLIVLYLLVKPTLLKEGAPAPKVKLRARHNRDYFEFDDSDLN